MAVACGHTKQRVAAFFFLGVGIAAWPPSSWMGFSGGRLPKRISGKVFASTGPGENSGDLEISKRNYADSLPVENTPKMDNFSDFASNKTPLLSKILNDQKKDEREVVLKEDSLQERSSEWVVAGLATFALVEILGDLLSNYEWVQTLRYFWPLSLGVYYGTLMNQANEGDEALRRNIVEEFGSSSAFTPTDEKSLLLQTGYIFGGLGLFVGGTADALLPVWMTGPNLVTNAGLAPDCAILLLVLSFLDEYNILGKNNKDETKQTEGTAMPLLLKITLWAELYKLGEGSLDEVFTNFQTIITSST